MSPPKKKRKTKKPSLKPTPTLEPYSISSLPDDLVLSCLARVSRLYYPILSLVSKKFRSLISSPELYEVRSLLGRTASCLYVCLEIYPDSNPRWFTLYRRLNTRKKKKKSSENLLVPIPIPSPQGDWPGVVAVGSNIFSIGGTIDDEPSSSVSVLDCRSHTWHQAPNMHVARKYPKAHVIDGKIYVIEVRKSEDNYIEVFDPKTQIWNFVSIPNWTVWDSEDIYSTEINGKICMNVGGPTSGKCVTYNPKDDTCEPFDWDMCEGWLWHSHCMIDNVPFYYDNKKKVFKWFDTKTRLWKNLKGVERMMMRRIAKDSHVKLVDFGGKIAVWWDRDVPSSGYENKVIWCGVIALERRDGDEILGTVEWFNVVLMVPTSCHTMRVLATML